MNAFLEKLFGGKLSPGDQDIVFTVAIFIFVIVGELLLWIFRKLFHFPPKIELPKLPFDLFELFALVAVIVCIIIFEFDL